MEGIIRNQKVYKRSVKPHLPSDRLEIPEDAGRIRNVTAAPAGLSGTTVQTAVFARLKGFVELKWLVDRYDPFTIVAAGGILLLAAMVLFAALPARQSAIATGTAGLFLPGRTVSTADAPSPALPADSGIADMLLAFLSPAQVEGEETILPPTPTLLSTVAFTNYTVKRGDTISGIASKHGLTIGTIISFNRIENAKRLPAGAVLKIPSMDGLSHTVGRGDSLSKIAKAYGVSLNDLIDANNLSSDVIQPGRELFIPGAAMRTLDVRKALGELFSYPVSGRLTSGYGMRADPFTGVKRFHYGIDLAAPTGAPVKAAMGGKVAVTGTNPTYGKYIILQHDDGYQSMYAHLNRIGVSKGDNISEGQLIGEVGSTGYSTGPHLHFAIFRRGAALDPMKLLYN
jgi:LysM repeat protein